MSTPEQKKNLESAIALSTQIQGLMKMNGCAGVVVLLKGDQVRSAWQGMGTGGAVDLLNTAKKSLLESLEKES